MSGTNANTSCAVFGEESKRGICRPLTTSVETPTRGLRNACVPLLLPAASELTEEPSQHYNSLERKAVLQVPIGKITSILSTSSDSDRIMTAEGNTFSSESEGAPTTNLREHLIETGCWTTLAIITCILVRLFCGSKTAAELSSGYIVEISLSVDNLFLFVTIFKYFNVPQNAQKTVLQWGVGGAIVLRGVFLFVGRALLDKLHIVTWFLALFLLFTSSKMLFGEDDDDDENIENNRVVQFARNLLPCTDSYHGDQFFITCASGGVLATPLFIVLISVELSDITFAVDSIPAVLGISSNVYVLYVSNMLAVMGLRSLYFVVYEAIKDLRFLKQSLAIVLGFVGVKMLLCLALHAEIPVMLSLGIIVAILLVGVIASVLYPNRNSEEGSEDWADIP